MSETGPRRRAREILLRVLYQSEIAGDPLDKTWREVAEEEHLPSEARAYADDLCAVLDGRLAEVDAALRRHLEHWSLERLGATDRGVLRLATAELLVMRGTPAKVVLDEAVDIARKYGRDESGDFVNGVLDRVARELRPGELESEARLREGRVSG
ncbi:MAG TPA: transcription antitermination factor NusB [Candidatus Eisenbacteria bacterium]|nr:transcription antitermination factor NusB [Candidatus Eisenbacteria bacterium]